MQTLMYRVTDIHTATTVEHHDWEVVMETVRTWFPKPDDGASIEGWQEAMHILDQLEEDPHYPGNDLLSLENAVGLTVEIEEA